MRIVYNLEENATSRSRMGESFLYGNFERQHSVLKRAAIPPEVRAIFDVHIAIIELETGVTSLPVVLISSGFYRLMTFHVLETPELLVFRGCNFAAETMFTAMQGRC